MKADRSPVAGIALLLPLIAVAVVVTVASAAFALDTWADYDEVVSVGDAPAAAPPPDPSEGGVAAPTPEEPAPTPPTTSSPPEDRSSRARELLGRVTVVPSRPDVPGYERGCGPGEGCVFGTEWSDDTDAPMAHNGCDTRNDVLARDLSDVRFSERSPGCDVTGGTFVDPYTGQAMDYAVEGSQIHIDHLFPLAAAWDLGAASWTPERRATFANDVTLELLAVNGGANLSKGDSTPASWLPPDKSFRCDYVTAYLEVADAYDLAVTAADVRVIEPVLDRGC